MRWLYCTFFGFVLPLISHPGCQSHSANTLRIATASNMQYALKEIVNVFEEQTGVQTELIISSSGKLTAQIIEGAPYDVLVSADMKYPNDLHQKGMTKIKPQIYASGKLVLWSLSESAKPSLETLFESHIKHIAAANPMTAPYGRAALEILEKIDTLSLLQEKLVYGESISQVNQFIVSQSAEIGFTSLSTVKSRQANDKGVWRELDSRLHTPIDQGAALIQRGNESNIHAQEFYTFLFSSYAQTILKDFGYSIYE